MALIDRYISLLFFRALAISFVSLTGLWIVIDTFGNIDEFMEYGKRSGNTLGVIFEYYGVRSLSFFDQMSGVLAMAGAMFALTWLHRTNELMALMAAGVSKARVARPLLYAAVLVSLLATLNRELLIPNYRERLGRNAQDLYGERESQFAPRYDNRTEILLGGRATVAAEQRIRAANFRLPPALGNFGRQIIAEDAFFRTEENGRPSGYLLRGVKQPEGISQRKSAALGGETVIYAPADARWLKPDECFVVSEVGFDQLESGAGWRDYSSTGQLITGLRNPSLDYGADVRTSIHARVLRPLLDVVLVLLALPLLLTSENRNVFVTAGWCVVVIAGFFMVVMVFRALGNNTLLSPALAAWCPLLIFAPLAAVLSKPLRE